MAQASTKDDCLELVNVLLLAHAAPGTGTKIASTTAGAEATGAGDGGLEADEAKLVEMMLSGTD